jgi:hypothetical protein
VLAGEFEFYGLGAHGKYAIRATAGATVHIPARAPHGYRIVGLTPGRLLIIFEPAGNMELLLAEGGTPVPDHSNLPPPAPPDPALLAALIAKYEIEVLEPLPGPAGG